jgi:hypothetical protein
MKAQSMRISAGVIALAVLIYMLACSSPSGNRATGWDLPPCKAQADPGAKALNIRGRLEDEIKSSSELAGELNPDPTTARDRFTVDVQQAAGKMYFEAYIKGSVGGDNNLKILSDIVNNYQEDPDDCLRVVHFVNLNAPNTPSGSKWTSCQYPKYVCTNGACCDDKVPSESPAPTPTPTPTPNPLTKPGANSNTSREGNTNN